MIEKVDNENYLLCEDKFTKKEDLLMSTSLLYHGFGIRDYDYINC